jgi:hypothetical protein
MRRVKSGFDAEANIAVTTPFMGWPANPDAIATSRSSAPGSGEWSLRNRAVATTDSFTGEFVIGIPLDIRKDGGLSSGTFTPQRVTAASRIFGFMIVEYWDHPTNKSLPAGR